MSKKKTKTDELLQEALEQHRLVKREILDLLSKMETPNMTKDNAKNVLFKIYLKLK